MQKHGVLDELIKTIWLSQISTDSLVRPDSSFLSIPTMKTNEKIISLTEENKAKVPP